MEWYSIFLLLTGMFIALMISGMPVAFTFFVINVISVVLFWGGLESFPQLIGSMFNSISNFSLLPIPLFILMGDVLFHTGVSSLFLNTLSKWIKRCPGRLSMLTVAGGAMTGAVTGVAMGSVALMGRLMLPEMKKHNYKDPMSLGPIVCTGGLALMIPPSVFAVVMGSVARISIGKILIAIIIPGITLASLYFLYIYLRSKFQPDMAPYYDVPDSSLKEKLLVTARDVLPVGFIIFCVTGVIFMGIGTPSEAAATGALGCFIVAAFYRRLNWEVVKKSLADTTRTTLMIYLIMMGAIGFSQTLSFSGATRGLVEFITNIDASNIAIFAVMITLLIVLGTFMDAMGLMLITTPVYTPIIKALGIDPIWYAVIMILAIAIGPITPPFGMDMFALKAVAPPDITMGRIYKAVIPFVLIDIFMLVILFLFPSMSTWLTGYIVY